MLRNGVAAFEARYRDANASTLLHLRFEALHSGESAILVVTEDISEHNRREQELVQVREALLQRERLRVLGQLAASIAHDLGNTLRGASFQLTTIRQGSVPPEEQADAIDAIAKRVEIASEAIARLHDFARTGTLGLQAVRLDRIVGQAVALVETDFRDSAAPVHVRLAIAELPPVGGSAAELSLLFVNLLCNARDAMPQGGVVTVAAQRTAGGVVVTVADEGTGIAPEVQSRLFEPFFTTKGSDGAGLGLWLASGTMERLGGHIRLTNRSGRGALVELTFPFMTAGESRRRPSSEKPRRRANRKRRGPQSRRTRPRAESPRVGAGPESRSH